MAAGLDVENWSSQDGTESLSGGQVVEHSSSVLDLSHPALLAPRALFTISTPWRAPSQVGIVAQSLAASGGGLHLP